MKDRSGFWFSVGWSVRGEPRIKMLFAALIENENDELFSFRRRVKSHLFTFVLRRLYLSFRDRYYAVTVHVNETKVDEKFEVEPFFRRDYYCGKSFVSSVNRDILWL